MKLLVSSAAPLLLLCVLRGVSGIIIEAGVARSIPRVLYAAIITPGVILEVLRLFETSVGDFSFYGEVSASIRAPSDAEEAIWGVPCREEPGVGVIISCICFANLWLARLIALSCLLVCLISPSPFLVGAAAQFSYPDLKGPWQLVQHSACSQPSFIGFVYLVFSLP